MDDRSLGIPASLVLKQPKGRGYLFQKVIPRRSALYSPFKKATRRWALCVGIGGRFGSDLVGGFNWIGWALCVGICNNRGHPFTFVTASPLGWLKSCHARVAG